MQAKDKQQNIDSCVQHANGTQSNRLSILILLIALTTLLPAASMAGQKLQLFYSNDVRSELEACG